MTDTQNRWHALQEEKGYSLIEVTVALMIFGLLVVALSVLFTTTFAAIARSGVQSEGVYESSDAAEKFLVGEEGYEDEDIETYGDSMDFFPGEFNLQGENISVIKELPDGREVKVHMFVPEKTQD